VIIEADELRTEPVKAEFFIDEAERRFWSPYLSVQVQDSEGGSFR
jgi:hypothetical protein